MPSSNLQHSAPINIGAEHALQRPILQPAPVNLVDGGDHLRVSETETKPRCNDVSATEPLDMELWCNCDD